MTSRSAADTFVALKSQFVHSSKTVRSLRAPKLRVSEFHEVKQATIDLAEGGEQSREGIIQSGKKREIGMQQGKTERERWAVTERKGFQFQIGTDE